jgi:hypothetical protein
MKQDQIQSHASDLNLVHNSSDIEQYESTPFAHVSGQTESFASPRNSQALGSNSDLMRSDMIKLAIGPTSNSALPCPRLCGTILACYLLVIFIRQVRDFFTFSGGSFCGGTFVFFCNLKTTVSIGLGSTHSSSQTVMKPVMTLFDSSFNFPSAMEWVSDGNQAKQAVIDAKGLICSY